MRNDIFHNTPQNAADNLSYPSLFNELNACSGNASELKKRCEKFHIAFGYLLKISFTSL